MKLTIGSCPLCNKGTIIIETYDTEAECYCTDASCHVYFYSTNDQWKENP